MSSMTRTPPIRSVKELHEHLHAAVQLELAVIPPYLCALYTLRPGSNEEASLIIRSVVVEEMLHMVLASNVLNAVGGTPRFANEADAPRYPAFLPDGETKFRVHLERFSQRALDTFLKIEEPSLPHTPESEAGAEAESRTRGTPREPARLKVNQWHYDTVGEFYAAIIEGLEWLTANEGEKELFSGDPARQVTSEYYYAGGGAPVVVHDLATARAALQEIVEQGEGEVNSIFDDNGDLAHFFR
ncbi:MAG TPA: ferritin-like protein, partial [Longimicrobium sp.]